jgi:YD repeat-containing protein
VPPSVTSPTSVRLIQVLVTPGFSGETAKLTAQVSSPAGSVNEGAVAFTFDGHTASATVNGSGKATTDVSLPAWTTLRPLSVGLTYSDATGVFAPSSSSTTAQFNLLDTFLPSKVRVDTAGNETVTEAVFGLTLGRSYDAQGRLTAVSINGIDLAAFSYNGQGQLTLVRLAGVPWVGLAYNDLGQLTALVSPGFAELFFYTPQGLPIGSVQFGTPSAALPAAGTVRSLAAEAGVRSIFGPVL